MAENKEVKDYLPKLNAKITGQVGTVPFYEALIVLIVVSDKETPAYIYDGSAVMGNLMLANTLS